MQSHDEVRRKIASVWQANQLAVVDRIRDEFGLKQFAADEIHIICGILEVRTDQRPPAAACSKARERACGHPSLCFPTR